MVIRNGKIARLPVHVREELNSRLLDNEPGKQLVDWLNAQPEVKEVLDSLFQGRPISEQNLSEWKNGGYVAWAVLHDCLDHAQLASEGADHIAATGVNSERLLSIITARLAELLNLWDVTFDLQAGTSASTRPASALSQQYAPVIAFNQRRLALQSLLNSVLALRKSEQRDARLVIDRERLELLSQKQSGKFATSSSSPASSSPENASGSPARSAVPSSTPPPPESSCESSVSSSPDIPRIPARKPGDSAKSPAITPDSVSTPAFSEQSGEPSDVSPMDHGGETHPPVPNLEHLEEPKPLFPVPRPHIASTVTPRNPRGLL